MALLLLGASGASLASAAGHGAGLLDPRFGQQGLRTLNFGTDQGSPDYQVVSAATGRNGDILVLISGVDNNRRAAAVARFNTDGTLDSGFGRDGMAYVTFPENLDSIWAQDVAVDRKGRVLVTGTTGSNCGRVGCSLRVFLLRLDRRGRLDPGFERRALLNGPRGSGHALLQDRDGSIYVGGDIKGDFRVTKFDEAGQIDRSFGVRGTGLIPTTSKGGTPRWLRGMARDREGRIAMVATEAYFDGERSYLGRMTRDGRVDRSFGRAGYVQPKQLRDAHGLVVTRSGRLVVGISSARFAYRCMGMRLLAFTETGRVDRKFSARTRGPVPAPCAALQVVDISRDRQGLFRVFGATGLRFATEKFGSRGKRIVDYGEGGLARFEQILGAVRGGIVDPLGRSIGFGDRMIDSGNGALVTRGRIGRFTRGGQADVSFGDRGLTEFNPGFPSWDEADLAWLDGGRVLVAGQTNAFPEPVNASVVAFGRFLPSGRPDRSFGVDGRVITELRHNGTLVASRKGSFAAGGYIDYWENGVFKSYFAISRFDRSGNLDPGWGVNGTTAKDALGRWRPSRMMAQPDDGMLLADIRWDASYISFRRLTPAGEIDQSYGDGGETSFRYPSSETVAHIEADPRGRPILALRRFVCSEPNESCRGTGVVVARVGLRGGRDPGFGNKGLSFIRMPKVIRVEALKTTGRGQILVVGTRCTGSPFQDCHRQRFVAKLNSSGSRVAGFGRNGVALYRHRGIQVKAVMEVGDGIMLGGEREGRPAVLRLRHDGTVESSWGRNGIAVIRRGLSGEISSFAGVSRGRVVAAGTLRTNNAAEDFFAAAFSEK